jgi:hypothetical protein
MIMARDQGFPAVRTYVAHDPSGLLTPRLTFAPLVQELTLRHVDREPALRGFLVDGLHVRAGLAHGRNDLIE